MFLRRILCVALLAGWVCCGLPSGQPAAAQPAGTVLPKDDGRLEAIGGLVAATIYSMHAHVVSVADAFTADVYSAEQAAGRMKPVISMLGSLKRQLLKVRDNMVDEDDEKLVTEAIAILGLIQEEARLFERFVTKHDNRDFDAFEATRNKAWTQIESCVDIK